MITESHFEGSIRQTNMTENKTWAILAKE
jgi:hypothetical protein